MAMLKILSVIFQRLPILQRQSLSISEQCCLSKTTEFSTYYSTDAAADTPGVLHIKKLLKDKFPLASTIEVVDISGGCGEMYDIFVETVEFKGLTVVKQHRLINETLKDEIKQMHGVRIETAVPPGKPL